MQDETTRIIGHNTQSYMHGLTLPMGSWFVAAADDAGARCIRSADGRVDQHAATLLVGASDDLVAHSTIREGRVTDEVVVRWGESFVYLLPALDGSAGIIVASPSPEIAHRDLSAVVELVRAGHPESPSVEIRMWHSTGRGSWESQLRSIEVRPVAQSDRGMGRAARRAVRRVRSAGPSGGVHVWHGPPGCGKTTAIRSLAQAWCGETTLEIILDPTAFLAEPAYMMKVLKARPARRTFEVDPVKPRTEGRVLVLEDAGEVLTADAGARVGNGMSRLLNLTDGMFGDRDRPSIIITTNEPVGKLHPALVRPGRCRSIIEFGPLDPEEARAWLARQGCTDEVVEGPMTIAELAALAEDADVDHATMDASPLGFT